MKITEDWNPAKDGKRLLIEWTGIDIVKHLESKTEAIYRKRYAKSKSYADMLMWLSEWARTEDI